MISRDDSESLKTAISISCCSLLMITSDLCILQSKVETAHPLFVWLDHPCCSKPIPAVTHTIQRLFALCKIIML